jgi:hypothetical protein
VDPATAVVDAAAAEVLAAFDENGVDALLLKGRALGALLYEVGERTGYADVDLLVAPPHLSTAEHVLSVLGYSVDEANRGIDDIGGIAHARSWVRVDRGPLDQRIVDLHSQMPGSRTSPAIAWEALTAQRTWIEVGGYRAATLNRCGQALHLAIHAAQHGPGFDRTLDELSLGLSRWPAEVWVSAAALARRIEATPAFAAGLRLLPEGAALASRLELPATAQLDWTIRNRGERPRGTLQLQALGELDSFGERLDLARRSLLPPRAWIIQEYHWARAGGPLIVAAYAFHWMRLPQWAARAWRHRLQARRAARAR